MPIQRETRPQVLDLTPAASPPIINSGGSSQGRTPHSMVHSRSMSVASDSPSLAGGRSSTQAPPVFPEPAYIAPLAASQIVTSDQDLESAEWAEAQGHDVVFVAPGALALINSFLDQMLYCFIRTARSTQLGALRPAIVEVLKPRLAGEAVAGADEELKEYLGGGDDDLTAYDTHGDHNSEFDLELSWKLARLRCMVYTRLGDMEEEDEEEHLERDMLNGSGNNRSHTTGKVSPAAAIFLTSILEFLGEHLLIIAGDSARTKFWAKSNADDASDVQPERMVVEECDVEKVALNATFGRLWRSWRKKPRSAAGRSLSRALSRDSGLQKSYSSNFGSRRSSVGTIEDNNTTEQQRESMIQSSQTPAVDEVPELDDPAHIPLPIRDNDIDEIEVPGLAPEIDEDDDRTVLGDESPGRKRPLSLFVFPAAKAPDLRPKVSHKRSNSVPTAERQALELENGNDGDVFQTPLERPDPIEAGDKAEGAEEKIATPRASMISAPTVVQSTAEPEPKTTLANGAVERAQGHNLTIPTPDDKNNNRDSTRYSTIDSSDVLNEYSRPLSDMPVLSASGSQGQTLNGLGLRDMDPHEASYLHEDSDPEHEDEIVIATATVPARKTDSLQQVAEIARVMTPKDITSFSAIRRPNSTAHSPASSTMPQRPFDRSSSQSSRFSQLERSPSRSLSNNQTTPERAAVQRLTDPSSYSPQSSSQRPRRSESLHSYNERRPIHTSGSGTSQTSSRLRGLVGRPSHDSNRQDNVNGEENELDKLIKSEETIHYTLTPQSVRGSLDSSPPRPRRTNTSDLADFLRSTAPPGDDAETTRLKKLKMNGLRSHPPERSPASDSTGFSALPQTDSVVKGSTMPPTPRQASFSSMTRPKNAAPRDPRAETNNLRDLAEFARMSGPDEPRQLPRPITGSGFGRKSSSDVSNRKPSISGTSPQMPQSRFVPPSRGSTDSRKASGPKLQARAAVTPSGEKTSDLIDFIREGPPRDARDPHRIPRSVAPFRTTMDSDELTALGEDKDGKTIVTQNSLGSFQDSVAKSHSSMNSRTGLLESSNKGRVPSNGTPNNYSNGASTNNSANGTTTTKIVPPQRKNTFADPDDDFKPQRKQRRVRDPYAIDDSDDDLEELMQPAPKAKPQRQEESLMDFLRNTTPPGENTPQPLAVNTQAMNHKPSTQSMKSRFLRSSSMSKKQGSFSFSSSQRPSTSTSRTTVNSSQTRVPAVPSLPPTQQYDSTSSYNGNKSYNPGMATSNRSFTQPQQPTPAPPLRSVSSNMSGSTPFRKQVKFEPRTVEPSRRTDTSDLADFFRDGPPPGIDVQPKPLAVNEKEVSGFSKIFSRRRRD